ncbi:TAXI family TRAP transporter solute-binding subunit [Wohlfahrtiimonas chitiniclastica]|uniref:TAXI family TRAP transporter solute-binding subunit n=1 Tax=Wohlfahrtiimonas chitiniclastica TaxID=400946 RepID=UPI0003735476|nr:TAXI family TRAP transporter solute-binding subunit [Wohlfahrtiimonas chitiniclastica]
MMKKIRSIAALCTLIFAPIHADELRNITVGYSDTLDITKEATNLVCFGFEADHPNNHCATQFVDSEVMWDRLMNNDIQIALMPEEVLIANQKQKRQPIIITPLYQQYLLLVGSHDVTLESVASFRDRTIGVTDWATKEHRGKPLAKSLGLTEKDVYFPISNGLSQLSDLFCSFSIDGVMIMSNPSSALVRELTTSCDGQILSFTDDQIQKIIKSSLGLYPGTIPKGMYWRMPKDINTLRSRTFLVVNPTPDVTDAVLESLEHIEDEINLTTVRTNITPKTIVDTYDINPIKLHPLGQSMIEQMRENLAPKLPPVTEEAPPQSAE